MRPLRAGPLVVFAGVHHRERGHRCYGFVGDRPERELMFVMRERPMLADPWIVDDGDGVRGYVHGFDVEGRPSLRGISLMRLLTAELDGEERVLLARAVARTVGAKHATLDPGEALVTFAGDVVVDAHAPLEPDDRAHWGPSEESNSAAAVAGAFIGEDALRACRAAALTLSERTIGDDVIDAFFAGRALAAQVPSDERDKLAAIVHRVGVRELHEAHEQHDIRLSIARREIERLPALIEEPLLGFELRGRLLLAAETILTREPAAGPTPWMGGSWQTADASFVDDPDHDVIAIAVPVGAPVLLDPRGAPMPVHVVTKEGWRWCSRERAPFPLAPAVDEREKAALAMALAVSRLPLCFGSAIPNRARVTRDGFICVDGLEHMPSGANFEPREWCYAWARAVLALYLGDVSKADALFPAWAYDDELPPEADRVQAAVAALVRFGESRARTSSTQATRAVLEAITANIDLRLRVDACQDAFRARASYLRRQRERFLRQNNKMAG